MSTTGCDTRQSVSTAPRQTPSPPPCIVVLGIGGVGCVTATRVAAATGPGPRVTLIDGRLPEDVALSAHATGTALAPPQQPSHLPLIRPGERTPFCRIPPEWFHDAALRHGDAIRARLRDADVVLLLAALGGGAGSGAAPVVARVARESGAVVIAVVSTPFSFEGRRRTRASANALAAIDEAAHLTLDIRADRLIRTPHSGLTVSAAYGMLDGEFDCACKTLFSLVGATP